MSRFPIVSSWSDNSVRRNDDSSDTPLAERAAATGHRKRSFRTRLVVHFDINETILLGDEAGGDSATESLHKMIAKSAFCRLPDRDGNDDEQRGTSPSWDDTAELEPTHWWDGTPIENSASGSGETVGTDSAGNPVGALPPLYTGWKWPSGCCPYYRTRYKAISKSFCQHHGKIYSDLFDHCRRTLETEARSNDNSPIIPAFWKTLAHLSQRRHEQPFTVVFRTFGNDLPDVAKAVTKFAQGGHRAYNSFSDPSLQLTSDRLYQGRWKHTDDSGTDQNGLVYQLWNYEETQLVASGDEEILRLLEDVPICGIRDDYRYWSSHDWQPSAGKPVWIPTYPIIENAGDNGQMTTYDHHVMFDDNIHNLPNDGIVCIRMQLLPVTEVSDAADTAPSMSEFLSIQESDGWRDLHGIHFVRTPTIEPILNTNWFIERLEEAQAKLDERISIGADSEQ